MPPHHLTTAPPHQLAAAVLTLLAGADLDMAAADIGLEATDLVEATMVYQAAGLAALERRAEAQWYQLRIEFPDWDTAEKIGANQLGPRLDELQSSGAIAGWWFLRKYPCWRLRLRDADIPAVDQVFDDLAAAGALTRWWPTVYEPETAAFGGPVGIQAAHDLFCADSRGVLGYARQNAPGLGRRELSILLINALLRAADMDVFERGDVFARVAQLRPPPTEAETAIVEKLTNDVRMLLAIPVQADSGPFASTGPTTFAAPWLTAWQAAGHQLGHAAAQGRLDRGLRAVLTHVLIFHWNRVGLSAAVQGILARAAAAALLPGSRPWTPPR
ncbi:thiopeptide-type bacteriocin biosynthesis protein [Nonomuraea wenchangensis]|uniref:thiopeptide-type bacteriocin biosynthesis protein n=1 Tax=Nonomuraea wenchangensis TaxID=568860 RepID=UPI0033CE9B89